MPTLVDADILQLVGARILHVDICMLTLVSAIILHAARDERDSLHRERVDCDVGCVGVNPTANTCTVH